MPKDIQLARRIRGEHMSVKSTQKKASKQPAEHPKYAEMIIQALHALKDRNGSSRQAVDKYVKNHFKVGDKASHFIKMALKRGVENGQFINTKGSGASGSFKVNKVKKSKGSQRPGEEDQNRRSSQQTKNKEGRRERKKDRPQTNRENQEIAG
ncbi:unnamed protein product [Porites lobata]|uniref:H15 domain-containing protein n=1 Tax=Porites lobata TaxID=104759 RepID=A0ABN8S664_9CNID|nr:unnamed protein product [Porites lobata]